MFSLHEGDFWMLLIVMVSFIPLAWFGAMCGGTNDALIPRMPIPPREPVKMNTVIEIARKAGRGYITPEDVSVAMKEYDPNKVRRDVLEVLAAVTDFAHEDGTLCAFNSLGET